MFRGGSYVDKQDFGNIVGKPGHNYMDTSDIAGAQPKKRFDSRQSRQLGGVGAQIIDNNSMAPAGSKKAVKLGQGSISELWSQGEQYHKIEAKNMRDPLSTKDINGGVKKNQFGAILPEVNANQLASYAGSIKTKPDKFENMYQRAMPNTTSKNRSQIFDHVDPGIDRVYNIQKENMPVSVNHQGVTRPDEVGIYASISEDQKAIERSRQQALNNMNIQNNAPYPVDKSPYPEVPRAQDYLAQPPKPLSPHEEMPQPSYAPVAGISKENQQAIHIQNQHQNNFDRVAGDLNSDEFLKDQKKFDQMLKEYQNNKSIAPVIGNAAPIDVPKPAAAPQMSEEEIYRKELENYERWKRQQMLEQEAAAHLQSVTQGQAIPQPSPHDRHEGPPPIAQMADAQAYPTPPKDMPPSQPPQNYQFDQQLDEQKLLQQRNYNQRSMKDYSREQYLNEWSNPNDGGMISSVALQAMGQHVPTRAPPPIEKVPMNVSLIQDPKSMNYNPYGSQQNRRSLREINPSNVDGQKLVENQFVKPTYTADRSPSHYKELWEIKNPIGKRVNGSKNNSTMFMMEDNSTPLVPPSHQGSHTAGSVRATPIGQKGKKQFMGASSSYTNLISGQYGQDKPDAFLEKNMKPYSKIMKPIGRPPLHSQSIQY